MKQAALAIFALVAVPSAALGQECETAAGHWSYEDGTGPACWAKMDVKNKLCGDGRAQSPVDIETNDVRTRRDAGETATSYKEVPLTVWNNGHAIQIQVPNGLTYKSGDAEYTLKQIHFHTPSEHRLDGRSFPLEAHLVHQAADGTLLVRGLLFEEGESHSVLRTLTNTKLPAKNETLEHDVAIDPADLVKEAGDYFTYTGSLTTPGCGEGVAWELYRRPQQAALPEIDALRKQIGFDNARPIQALNDRVIELVTPD